MAAWRSIAKEIDGYAPGGENWHQDLLDQMAASSEIRPAVLDATLYERMVELKGFRHVVTHNYGSSLKLDRVEDNLALLQRAYPEFVAAVASLEAALNADDAADGHDGPSRPTAPG